MKQSGITDAPLTLADIAEPARGDGKLGLRLRRKGRKFLFMALPRGLTRQVERGGLRYELKGDEMVHRNVIKVGVWEPRQIEFFFNTARGRGADIFLDIGANFGYYSLLAARLGIFDEIHALEPQPETYRKLLRHIHINGFEDKITPHNIAASNVAREMKMLACRKDSGGAKVFADNDGGGETLAIAAAPLDSRFSFRGRNIAIKVDIEGHAPEAIKGAKNLLAHNRVFLQVEVWESETVVINDLIACGFSLMYYCDGDFYFNNDAKIKG